jgi:FtsX extracellular domain
MNVDGCSGMVRRAFVCLLIIAGALGSLSACGSPQRQSQTTAPETRADAPQVGLGNPILRSAPARTIEVFVTPNAGTRKVQEMRREIAQADGVEAFAYVSKKSAMRILTDEVATVWLKNQLKGLHHSFLPSSFIIVAATEKSANTIAAVLSRSPLVDNPLGVRVHVTFSPSPSPPAG